MLLASQAVTELKGVGPKVAIKLQQLGLYTLQDVLFHLPLRYEDRTRIYPLANAVPGVHGTFQARVINNDVQFGRRRSWVLTLQDDSGTIKCRFFHFSQAQRQVFQTGTLVRGFGEFKAGKFGLEMLHPECKVINEHDPLPLQDTLTPIYPTTEGVKQITLRNITEQALLALHKGVLPELFPADIQVEQWSLKDALQLVHRPPVDVALSRLDDGQHPAQQRLIVEELCAHHLSMLQARSLQTQQPGHKIIPAQQLTQRFLQNLPFTPTAAQQRVVADIEADLQIGTPMMRLVQGDVGSGKTLVAALAALSVIDQGLQVALMAPTEILAEQHATNFANWLSPLGINIGWLAGKLKGKARNETLQRLASGEIQMLVGTHALFQDAVEFANLALVIIDEQHRFGVHQRLALRAKGKGFFPHQLVMTATPIPRTLAMTAYADLDTSVIDELPPGRTPIKTVVLPNTRRAEVMQRVAQAISEQGRQVYWVCTLIEESEVLQSEAAEDTAVVLRNALPGVRVGLVHGRMKAAEKQAVMDDFKGANLDLLVATTVIEVGVDVPNASLMIIENPERLGLAQLHQLRGRVGRGSVESHCVLLYAAPLSKTASRRLQVLRDSNDGFYIAQQDLQIRGPGELMGTRQTGLAQLKIADLSRDDYLLDEVQTLAEHIYQQHPQLAAALVTRWLGSKQEYSNA